MGKALFSLHDAGFQIVVEIVGMLDDHAVYTTVDGAEGALNLGQHALVDGAIDAPLLSGGLVGVAGIRCRGLHGIVVRFHQQGRARIVPQRCAHINIIIYALHLALDVGLEECLYDVGRGSLVARHRGRGNEPVEQRDRLYGELLYHRLCCLLLLEVAIYEEILESDSRWWFLCLYIIGVIKRLQAKLNGTVFGKSKKNTNFAS